MSHINTISFIIVLLLGIVIAESSVPTALEHNLINSNNTNTTIPFFTIAFFEDYILGLLNETLNDTTSQCHKELRNKFNLDDPSSSFPSIYIKKLLLESSKTTNELTGFYQCLNLDTNENEIDPLIQTVYLLIIVDTHETHLAQNNSNSTSSSSLNELLEKYVLGVCAPYIPQCNDYKDIIENIYKNVSELIDQRQSELEFTVHYVKSSDFSSNYISTISKSTIGYFIPLILIVIMFVVFLFRIFPFWIFKYFFVINEREQQQFEKMKNYFDATIVEHNNQIEGKINKELLLNEDNKNKKYKYNKNDYSNFINEFNLHNNTDELFSTSTQLKLYNLTGISYVKGLQGLALIFYTFGNIFLILFNSPIVVPPGYNIISLIKNFFFHVFVIGIRYSPQLMLSCSAYILIYKFLYYLDDAYERLQEEKAAKNAAHKQMNSENIDDDDSQSEDSKVSDESSYHSKKLFNKGLSFTILLKFWVYQLHKYILYVLFILFIHFSLYELMKLINNNKTGASWEFVRLEATKLVENKLNFKELIKGITCIYSSIPRHHGSMYFMNYFWYIENEILLFLFISLFIFYGYNNRIHFMKGLGIVLILIVVIKGILLIVSVSNKENHYEHGSFMYLIFHLPDYFTNGNFIDILHNPLYNLSFYIIGLFFGSCNYIIQKSIIEQGVKVLNENPFLETGIAFIKMIKKRDKKSFTWIINCGLIVVALFSFSQTLTLTGVNPDRGEWDKANNNYFRSLNKFILTFDIGLVIGILHTICFVVYLFGENFITKFLSKEFWIITNKLCFSYVLSLTFSITYILYQSDANLQFNFGNLMLYTIICGTFNFFISVFVFMFFEVPFKRVVKLIANSNSKVNGLTMDSDYDRISKETFEDINKHSKPLFADDTDFEITQKG